MIKLMPLSALFAFLLAGCASQSVYAPAEKPSAAGYSEAKLSENRYRVSFSGNSYTPSSTVKDYALLRSAELTLQQGNDWFRVVERDTDKKVRTSTTVGGGTDFPSQTSVYQSCGVLGCTSTVATSPGFSTGVDVGTSTSSTAYSSALEIVMGKNPLPENADAYDARKLASAIRERMTVAEKK